MILGRIRVISSVWVVCAPGHDTSDFSVDRANQAVKGVWNYGSRTAELVIAMLLRDALHVLGSREIGAVARP